MAKTSKAEDDGRLTRAFSTVAALPSGSVKGDGQPAQSEPGHASLFQAAIANWWIVVLSLGLCLASAAYFASAEVPLYKARTTLIIGPKKDLKEAREVSDTLNTLDRRSVVATLAMLPSSRTVRDAARQQTGLSDDQIASYTIKTSVVPDSNALEVTAEGPDAAIATRLLDALADQAVARTGTVYGIFEMQVLDRARTSSTPASVGWPRRLLAGSLFGLIIGAAAAFALAWLQQGGIAGLFASPPEAADGRQSRLGRMGHDAWSTISVNLRNRSYGKPRSSNGQTEPGPID
ncbi:MAG TPA: hypothetical protein PK680_03865 [Novosphingobium sp.]|nr:hypothetical protein [Novosphingobium sp.]HQA17502.1 hypothetical protein [Novosphingobium sp.]